MFWRNKILVLFLRLIILYFRLKISSLWFAAPASGCQNYCHCYFEGSTSKLKTRQKRKSINAGGLQGHSFTILLFLRGTQLYVLQAPLKGSLQKIILVKFYYSLFILFIVSSSVNRDINNTTFNRAVVKIRWDYPCKVLKIVSDPE